MAEANCTLYAVKSGSVSERMNLDDGVTVASIISNVSSSLKLLFFSSSSMHSDSMVAFKLPSLRIFVNDTLFCKIMRKKNLELNLIKITMMHEQHLPLNRDSFAVIASILQNRAAIP